MGAKACMQRVSAPRGNVPMRRTCTGSHSASSWESWVALAGSESSFGNIQGSGCHLARARGSGCRLVGARGSGCRLAGVQENDCRLASVQETCCRLAGAGGSGFCLFGSRKKTGSGLFGSRKSGSCLAGSRKRSGSGHVGSPKKSDGLFGARESDSGLVGVRETGSVDLERPCSEPVSTLSNPARSRVCDVWPRNSASFWPRSLGRPCAPSRPLALVVAALAPWGKKASSGFYCTSSSQANQQSAYNCRSGSGP